MFPVRQGSPGSPAAAGAVRRGRARVLLALGGLFIVTGVASLVFRILFVRWGVLYGAAAVSHVDAVIGSLVVLGLAIVFLGWSAWNAETAKDDKSGHHQRWTDWVSGVTALVGAVTLVVSLVNLFEPLTAPGLARPACPGGRVYSVQHGCYCRL